MTRTAKGSSGSYLWSPDGTQIAFTRSPKKDKTDEAYKERFGAYELIQGLRDQGLENTLVVFWLSRRHLDFRGFIDDP